MSTDAASNMGSGTNISPTTLSEVQAAFREYCSIIERSDLSPHSQATYIDMAGNFVRWMRGDFNPGSRLAPYVKPKKSESAA
jgi:hypothetical protein